MGTTLAMADVPTNILLISSDQQHYDALGVTNSRIRTPALDRLAGEGTRFDRAYCTNPTCTPSRASIITGLYPSWHGAWSLGTKLSEDVPTVGDVFRRHGYATALIGKAHFQPVDSQEPWTSLECQPTLRDLNFWRHFHGPWYGFEHVEVARNHADESHAGQHYAIWMEDKGLTDWRDYFQPWPPDPAAPRRRHVWNLPQEYHYSVWTAERTIAHIERVTADGRPFFTWASFHDPHSPYLVSEPWASMYDPADMEPGVLLDGEFDRMPPHFAETQKPDADFAAYQETPFGNHGFCSHLVDDQTARRNIAVYYGMTSFVDQQVGRILDALDRLDLTERTLVIFTSDHGGFLGQHGLWNTGAFHYEDVLRVPFLVRWPGRVPAGRVSGAMQSLIDLPGTFLAACGLAMPGRMQSVNQLDVWCDVAEPARDHVIVENRHQPTAIHLRTYVEDRWKITMYRDHDYGELFDLHDDPQERHNRWDDPACAAIKAELMQRWLNAEMQREPLPMPRIAHA